MVTTALFIIGEVLMWPFSYIKMVFHKLTMVWVYSKSYRTSRADKFMRFIYFFFMGPFITIGNTVVDTLYFIKHMVKIDIQKVKHKTRNQIVAKENLEISR